MRGRFREAKHLRPAARRGRNSLPLFGAIEYAIPARRDRAGSYVGKCAPGYMHQGRRPYGFGKLFRACHLVFHAFGLFGGFFHRADVHEGAFGQVIPFAFRDLTATAYGVHEFHI